MNIDVFQGLNEAQKESVETTEGYVRVIAGAGSGKTKALTSRYVHLVNNLGISTASILSVTFTNKAAREMKKRIRTVSGDRDTGLVCTFHGFCRFLLKEDIYAMNYPSNFIVMDTDDMDSILRIVYEQANISSRQYTFSQAKDMISLRKNAFFEHIPYILNSDNSELKNKFLTSENVDDRIFFGYLYQQKKSFNLDFNDLMTFTIYILQTFKEIREKWQQKLEYIMVDEFQDVSRNQYLLVSLLSEYHKNLFVVGDPDQTIYSWRGARVEFILNFDKVFKNCRTIMMNTNYRSMENIINASNSLISKNTERIDKQLVATKKGHIPVMYNHAKTIYDEAKWIVNQVKNIIEGGKSYKDITILYRAHYVSRSIEEEFLRNKIPYILYSGTEFYQRKEIKDILSYLRMIAFEDDLSFMRIINEPKRNFGKKRMELISRYAEDNNCSLYNSLIINIEDSLISKSKACEFVELIEKYKKVYKEMTLTDLLMEILNNSGYETMLRESGEDERLDNLAELKNSIKDYEMSAGEETTLEDYLQEISLFTNNDLKEKKDNIKMMTLHSSKGLEFPYVFVCGLNEGIFPSNKANTKEKMEEERRLAYVGYTRAENALFLSDAEGVNYNGSFRYPSRFIFNTEKTYLNYTVELEEGLLEEAGNYIICSEKGINKTDKSEFEKGDKIKHKFLGIGIITDVNFENAAYIIKFNNFETARNISFSTELEKIEAEDVEILNNDLNQVIETVQEIGYLEYKDKETVKKESKQIEIQELKQSEVCKGKQIEEEKIKREVEEEKKKEIIKKHKLNQDLTIVLKLHSENVEKKIQNERIAAEKQEKKKLISQVISIIKYHIEEIEKQKKEQSEKEILKEKLSIILKFYLNNKKREILQNEIIEAKRKESVLQELKRKEEENIKKQILKEDFVEIMKLYYTNLKKKINEENEEAEKQQKAEYERCKAEKQKLELERLHVKKILEIKNEIVIQERIASDNKFKFFGKGALAKKEARNKLEELYSKLSDLLNDNH